MMKKNFAIGTVCLLKNGQSVMIIGYFASKYENGIKTYDYEAIKYPEGTLSQEKYYFDENDINEVLYNGYKDSSYDNMIKNFGSETSSNKVESSGGYIFDENGMVIADLTVNDTVAEIENTIAEPKFKFDENGIVIADSSTSSVEEEIELDMPKFKFDENGIVILDNTAKISSKKKEPKEAEIKNPFEISESISKADAGDSEKWPIFKDIKFDENGIVVEAIEN